MFALEPGTSGPALAQFGALLESASQALRGIVVMSPHWMARAPSVMTNPAPATWHDFGGFPQPLYQLQYPAPGSADLGSQVLGLLAQAGIAAQADSQRPFDHGAWVPLMHMFPKANVPVVQVALPVGDGPREVFAFGHALRSLRAQGVLLLGSGSMTHNLSEFFSGSQSSAAYVDQFSRWVERAVTQGDLNAMLDYRAQAPHAERAHPSDDHFLPIFFALGAADFGATPAQVRYLSREVMNVRLAMDSFAVY